MRFLLGFFLMLAAAAPAAAQTPAVEFLGQKFEKKFEGGDPKDGSKFTEFGLPPEPIKEWTRLVTYRHYPKREADAVKSAHALARNVMARDKGARHAVIANEKTKEAIVDFLTTVKDDEMEFDVFKFTLAPGGGLVATQYAYRFKLPNMTVEEMKKIRTAAIAEMAKYDQKKNFEHFGLK